MGDLISVVIPVYNEEKAVEYTINQVKYFLEVTGTDYEIIIVNDGSKDHSREILENIQGIKLINHPYNLGYGASLKTGIKASKGDYILITDAHGTYPLENIPRLLKYIPEYDMVVGARTGKDVNIPLLRRPAKKILSIIANFLSRRRIPDLNSGFRIFKKELALRFFHLFPSNFSFTTTLTLAALTNDYTVKYIRINYEKRKGKSSIRPIQDFLNFTSLIFRVSIYFNPLRIFVPFGLGFFVFGMFIILYFAIITNFKDKLSLSGLLFIMLGIQIIFLGILADLIVKRGSRYETKNQ